jgi:hypothetical protein
MSRIIKNIKTTVLNMDASHLLKRSYYIKIEKPLMCIKDGIYAKGFRFRVQGSGFKI